MYCVGVRTSVWARKAAEVLDGGMDGMGWETAQNRESGREI